MKDAWQDDESALWKRTHDMQRTLIDTALERVTRAVVVAAGALPRPVQRLLAGRPVRVDGNELNLEIQLMLRMLTLLPGSDYAAQPVATSRAQVDSEARLVAGAPIPMGEVRDLTVPGPAGPIPVRLYRPTGLTPPAPAVVYLHGGGYALGSLDSHDNVCRFLAAHAEVAVLAVDYRLAPEHPYPAAVEDALATFHHVALNAVELGIDPQRIAVAGDSAGGGLAAVLAQVTAADGGPRPAFQLLFFPLVDMSTKHRSYQLFSDGYFLTEAQQDWSTEQYLPDRGARTDPRASPLLADDLAGLPPAYIGVAGFDVLRDEGQAYAARLREAGVTTTLRTHHDLVHSFIHMTGYGRAGRDALREAVGALRVGLSERGPASS